LPSWPATPACTCRHTLHDEARILLVHGLLHLLGFDHEAGAEEAAAMERAERLILSRLGWQARPRASLRGMFIGGVPGHLCCLTQSCSQPGGRGVR